MESLPQDILLDILARLNTKSLLSLCLVSKPMHCLSRPLLFQGFDDGYHSERSLKRLRIFSQQLQTNTDLAPRVRSINVGHIEGPYISDLQVLLKHTPNLRHLCVPAGHFIEFLNNLLRWQNYLSELQSFETYYGPRIYKPLQCKGDLLLRHITIAESNLGYTILARLIQSCKRLETFSYHSPSGWDAEDSEPTTIIQALLLHKDSLTYLGFDFRSRDYHLDTELEDFDQVPKKLSVPQDCLPRKPLLPPSLKVLCIESSLEPLEPELFYNLGMASQLSLKLLKELYVFPSDDHGWPDGLFDGFDSRVFINLHDD
ncbi:hypothetical protein BJX99DRAFT_269145 [Aspergillus californicus]